MNVKCVHCLQKHLALCKSFIRQVLDGHGEGGFPDHRDDIDGELTNAELHATLIDAKLTAKIKYLRKELQSRRFIPNGSQLQFIYILYHYSDKFHYENNEISQEIIVKYQQLPQLQLPSNISSPFKQGGCGCQK